MLKINEENGVVTIVLPERVDSNNAPDIEKEIWDRVNFDGCKTIIVDADELVMISSAGLRIMLKMRKLCDDLTIKNVSSDCYEVFDMTGFTEMMKVEKAFRKLSVDGCEVLGSGSNGVVYRYDPEIVVKVYRNANALAEIERERKLARRALVLGIPTAIPFDIVRVGETYGSVFELLNSKSFSKLIAAEDDNKDKYIELFVDLLKKIHSTKVDTGELEDMKKVAVNWAEFLVDYLPEETSQKLISLIKAVPEVDNMIHGDYHTNNVQMQNGEVLLIDMDTLSFGHPIFELASMFLGFVGFGELNHSITYEFMKLSFETTSYIWHKSLQLYLNTTDENKIKEIEDKAKIIGYARLMRRTIRRIGFDDPEGKAIIDNCKEKLIDLVSRIDSLDFTIENDSVKENKITVAASVENIETVTNFVNAKLEELDCPMKIQVQIDVAIDELFGNIAHYAYHPEVGEASVEIEIEEDPLAVIITFMDGGVPFDPLKHEDPDTNLPLEDREIGGLGMFIVKKSMDDIAYEYKDGKNILKIKKYL